MNGDGDGEVLRQLPGEFGENSAPHRVFELVTSDLPTNAVTHGGDSLRAPDDWGAPRRG